MKFFSVQYEISGAEVSIWDDWTVCGKVRIIVYFMIMFNSRGDSLLSGGWLVCDVEDKFIFHLYMVGSYGLSSMEQNKLLIKNIRLYSNTISRCL